MASMVKSVDILPNTYADHSPLELNIWFRRVGSRRWRMDEQILKHEAIRGKLVDEMKMFFQVNDDGYPSAKLLWDSFKAFIRGRIISLTASMKKDRQQQLCQILNQLKQLEIEHQKTYSKKTLKKIKILRAQRDKFEMDRIQKQLAFLKLKSFEEADKPGK